MCNGPHINFIESDVFPPLPLEVNSDESTADGFAIEPKVQRPNEIGPIQRRRLKPGCYLINYKPVRGPLVSFDGTLRVEGHSLGKTASGDLYARPVRIVHRPFPLSSVLLLTTPPNPANGIPVLARNKYVYYIRVISLLENTTYLNYFNLGYELYKYTAPNTWKLEGSYTAKMKWINAPAGYPSAGDYFEGDVKNAAGAILGRLSMGWISQYLRKAIVEIDTVNGSEAPLSNGAGVEWQNVFDEVGWEVHTYCSSTNVPQASGVSWSDAEMHTAMLARRDASNLDKEWRYHILSVKNLDSTSRGIMYDNGGTDSNNVPREGVGIASHWNFPNTTLWGLVAGQRSGASPKTFFRTAVHEIGHAMGLFHNTVNNGLMNTTDVIANSANPPANPFPNNVIFSFAEDDKRRLRHYPDMHVRPGGTNFGDANMANPTISPIDQSTELEGLNFSVAPLLETIPVGAPVRVNVRLENNMQNDLLLPSNLSLKGGNVSGEVINSTGQSRSFSPIVICLDEEPLKELKVGEKIESDLTLLRGKEGALFPNAGLYTIKIDLHWEIEGMPVAMNAETKVMVTPVVDESHAKAALKTLSTPDLLLTLVLGGDHLKDGIEALNVALHDKTLRPHYTYTESKRISKPYFKRKAELKKAADMIKKETVMSKTEVEKARLLFDGLDKSEKKSVFSILDAK
ncbi:MAG: matrixin family metalloprotease [Saprospiraceae bacterium]|nr:matrixin family metalloprotease [Saprospiraceae bacterium]MBK7787828.1 matrixin family metalloprotease [Saprospiraceae bacterium]MBK8849999.1 matrixin family metalloprotease [Saprospiraceae bacterium]MBK9686864.1 matrixin family metalloprotease [Saprospiraceae bacterium]MBL0081631.1 matrixin family metalloprotease [Saprospiraceae bacterium]